MKLPSLPAPSFDPTRICAFSGSGQEYSTPSQTPSTLNAHGPVFDSSVFAEDSASDDDNTEETSGRNFLTLERSTPCIQYPYAQYSAVRNLKLNSDPHPVDVVSHSDVVIEDSSVVLSTTSSFVSVPLSLVESRSFSSVSFDDVSLGEVPGSPTESVTTEPSDSVLHISSILTIDDDHEYAHKEVKLERSVALLMNFSGSKRVERQQELSASKTEPVAPVVANAPYGAQVLIAKVKHPTTFAEEQRSDNPPSYGSVSYTSDISFGSPYLLSPSAFATDTESEEEEDFYEYDVAHLEKSVSLLIKDSKAPKYVNVFAIQPHYGVSVEYVEPDVSATAPATSESVVEEVYSASSNIPRSASAPTRTRGLYHKATRSSSLKSITRSASNTLNAAKAGRSEKPKVTDQAPKAGKSKSAKENLNLGTSMRSLVKRTWH